MYQYLTIQMRKHYSLYESVSDFPVGLLLVSDHLDKLIDVNCTVSLSLRYHMLARDLGPPLWTAAHLGSLLPTGASSLQGHLASLFKPMVHTLRMRHCTKGTLDLII